MLTPEKAFYIEFGTQVVSDEEVAQSPMRNYFKGKTIFLTGATGFIGQLLLEKLLRCDIKQIYVLARAKKDKPPEERLTGIFAQAQFARLKAYNPNFMQQVSIIVGDMSSLGLALKTDDLQLMQETVEIVLHAAADVRFNERIYDLALTNLRGTRELLKLADNFKKLQVFNYISTAYSNCAHGYHIKEDFYAPPIDPEAMIAYVESCRERAVEFEHLEYITERLIGAWPNTYTFSKALSEEMVRRFGDKFPICVVRPSIIISTFQEPTPGWCNNLFGLNGVFVAIGAGFMRLFHAASNLRLDVICADFTVNSILATTWATHETTVTLNQGQAIQSIATQTEVSTTPPPPRMYALVSSSDYICLDYLMQEFGPLYQKYPSIKSIWTTCVNYTNCPFLYWYLTLFYHFFANIIFDLGLALMKHKMRLLPIYRKMQVFAQALSYFTRNEWKFDNEHMQALWDHMHPIDQKLFRCDTRQFEFSRWSLTFIQGLKYYMIGDPLNDQRKARIHQMCLNFVHFFVRIGFYLLQAGIIYVLAKPLGLVDFVRGTAISTVEFFKQGMRLMNEPRA